MTPERYAWQPSWNRPLAAGSVLFGSGAGAWFGLVVARDDSVLAAWFAGPFFAIAGAVLWYVLFRRLWVMCGKLLFPVDTPDEPEHPQ